MEEVWKDIPGYEGKYQVSTLGRVKSLPRYVDAIHPRYGTPYKQRVKGRIKKTTVNAVGYPVANLGHNDVKPVHVLVALAFLGEPLPDSEVRHLDGDRKNCCLSNLSYGSHLENVRDKRVYGGVWMKLTADDVREIRRRREKGETVSELAKAFNVSTTNIYYVCNRKTFGWVE